MSNRIHEIAAAGAVTGAELAELTRLSPAVTLTASTISFLAADNSINDSGGGLIAAGFVAGKSINVTGAVAGANNLYSARITIAGLTASKMIIAAPAGDAIVDGAAGPSITIAQWESKRTSLQEIADLAGGGDASTVTYTPTTLADWNGSADPGNADDAFDQLAERVKDLETASPAAPDASIVTYTPTDATDWNGSADPGDVDNALDQLAQRVKDVEAGGTGDVGGPASAVNNSIAVFDGATGKLIKDGGATIASLVSYGKQAIWIAAGSITPSATGGPAVLATIASAANQPDIQTLDFDATTQEYAQFSIHMPSSWNEGTVTFKPVWSHAATTTNFGVVWDLQAVAVSDDDGIAVAFGTAQTSTDTGGTTNDVYIGPESSAITVSGTPAAGDMVFFRLSRVTGNGSDTMAIDARLHGITVFITTDAATDS